MHMLAKFRRWVGRLFRRDELARRGAKRRPRSARLALETLEDRAVPAASLALSGFPSPVTAGTAGSVTVTAMAGAGGVDTSYAGTVHFTSSDAQAALPADYAFTAADAGAHTFSVTLQTAGTQSITATDTLTPSITGTQGGLTVTPAAAASLSLSGLPASSTAGTPGSETVTALDAYGNVATGYTGTVHFKSTDPQAALPADYAFTAADAGTHTFGVTLQTAGTQSVMASDTAAAGVTGTQDGLTVTPAAAASLSLSGLPASSMAGTPGSGTVTALDAYGNVATGYTGTVHFTSSDAQAALLADYAFTAADAGAHTFTVTLQTVGTQSVTATDTAAPGVTGTQGGLTVSPVTTTTVLAESADAIAYGAPVSFTATVLSSAPGSVVPTGTVRFLNGTTVLGSAALDGSGRATLTTSSLHPGRYAVTAAFGGDGNSLGNTSDALTLTVGSPNQRFLEQAYQDFLHRDADPGSVAYWGARLDGGASRVQVALAIEQSQEGRAAVVEELYQKFLRRDADALGLSYWGTALASGVTVEAVEAGILGSPEYVARFGQGSAAGYLSAVYHDVLNRPVDPAGWSYWGGLLTSGTPDLAVAAGLVNSPEAQAGLIQTAYQTFLGRPAGASAEGYWLPLLQQGLGSEGLRASVVGSDEFFSRL